MKPSKPIVRDLGEFGLIERLRQRVSPGPSSVLVGIGDDVAVLRSTAGRLLLATCDTQVEGIHFLRHTVPPRCLGQRAAAVNLSDMAAMGGVPSWALVSLMLPDKTPVAWVDALYRGLTEGLERYGAALVGGNTARHPERIVVDVTLLGEVDEAKMVLRRGAHIGDFIVVTGSLGASKAGLECLRVAPFMAQEAARTLNETEDATLDELEMACGDAPSQGEAAQNLMAAVDRDTWMRAVHRYWVPEPRVQEGQVLAASGWVHAMIDVSDGFLGDLAHLCAASDVGAVIHVDAVPVDWACQGVAQALGQDPLLWALTGGEDYEILAAVHPEGLDHVLQAVAQQSAVTCHAVGRIVPRDQGIQCVRQDGSALEAHWGKAWDHFRQEAAS
ncbi:thiamine-phosphate kinase [Desulfosoma caldarium]|uniref:Thiamine-monophosphate kinase n=1 Tax=Desulfosoma caldarium TaxID=610254 RepID=A0A3N1V0B7_9BACT|nr:thiamine-phosphate kinase [Desulfosoma caldarium]ROQ93571.1 thiamine-phosphate kinase [Desulfosoma caldarium]